MKADSKIRSFHDTENELDISKAGKGHWVVSYKPQRTVDYQFYAHYHPYTDELIEKLNIEGLQSLLDPKYQADLSRELDPDFYQPGTNVMSPFPKHEIDVSNEGPYSVYNWELFFHGPLTVAVHLSVNQRFEDAQRWFHRIFDPTSTDTSVPPPSVSGNSCVSVRRQRRNSLRIC